MANTEKSDERMSRMGGPNYTPPPIDDIKNERVDADHGPEVVVLTDDRNLHIYEIGAIVKDKAKRNAGHEDKFYGVIAKSAFLALDLLRDKLDLEKVMIVDVTCFKRGCRVDAQ